MVKKRIFSMLFIFCISFLLLYLPSSAEELDSNYIFNINEEVLPLKEGSSYQLNINYESPEYKDQIVWYSSDPSIASINQDGIIKCFKSGQVQITAEYDSEHSKTDLVTIKVLKQGNKSWGKKNNIWYLYLDNNCLTGWQYVGGTWYYMDPSGAMQTGWKYIGNKWYYMDSSGAMQTGWRFIDDAWYFLSQSGAMHTGWLQNENIWYYLTSSGAMATGLQKVGNTTYFFNQSGAMQTGWRKVDGKWYYFQGNGSMKTGWLQQGKTWYYLDPESGIMTTGWKFVGGKWYFMNASGAMTTGWQYVNGKWYLMNSSGSMTTGWQYTGGAWYLMNSSGEMLTGWQKIGTVWYYLQASGNMATETVVVNGRQEVFHTSGKWIDTASMDTKAANYSSNTNYLILVSLSNRVTKIYRKSGSSWNIEKAYLCTIGDSSKGWDTIRGTFYIGQSAWGNPTWKGYSFNDSDGHTLYYWTRFCDSFLFHSILYDGGTWNESTYGNGLGQELSHGCVRMRWQNAKWIYDNIPYGTKVIVY